MMKKREYKRARLLYKRCRCRLLCVMTIMCLCVVVFSGCGSTDRAVVFSWQEDTETAVTDFQEGATSGEESQIVTDSGNDVDGVSLSGNDAGTGTENAVIYIHVCGAVQNPGVVELPMGSRAEAALQAAGGFSEHAQCDYVNLAALLEDGQRLYFPNMEEVGKIQEQNAIAPAEGAALENGKVNINTANVELLCTLPGIGETKAQAIIAYRKQHGAFRKIEDIMQVSGIKQSAYDKLCDKITVE